MQLPLMPVPADKVVVLERRDLDAQRRSIDIQSKRESFPVDADELIQKSATVLTRYIKEIDPEVLFVNTEDLNSQIKNIINFLENNMGVAIAMGAVGIAGMKIMELWAAAAGTGSVPGQQGGGRA